MSTEQLSSRPAETQAHDVLAHALAGGGPVTIEVWGENGSPIRAGSRIVGARAYDLVTPASRGRPEQRETVVYLKAEADAAPDVQAALERLFEVASRHSGQSRIVAQFLLAWWNGPAFGGFVISDLFGLDAELAADVAAVFTHLSRRSTAAYVDAYGFGEEMRHLVDRYAPHDE